MPYSRTLKIGLTLGAGVVVAGTAAGVTYAATTTTSKVVYACANKSGTLRLLSKGKCPSGYGKVAINQQGPRGLTGARGPQGPGAILLTTASTANAVGSPVKIVALGALNLDVAIYCKPGTNAQLSIGFHPKTTAGDWVLSGTTYSNAPTNSYEFGLEVNSTSFTGDQGAWGFDKTVTGSAGNTARLSVGYDAVHDLGYRAQGSLLLVRGTHSATVEFAINAVANDACSARAQITPSS